MMDKVIFDIIEILVIVIVTLVGRYAVPYLKNKLGEQKLTIMVEWAKRFVHMAEQVINGEKQGEAKRDLVSQLLVEKAKELNIKLSEDEIRTLIEDAYTIMIKNRKGND